jgi:hypothetical protein
VDIVCKRNICTIFSQKTLEIITLAFQSYIS